MTDRRLHPRTADRRLRELSLRVRPGMAVSLIDVSAGGALVEGARPLPPGSRVELQLLDGPRKTAMPARVVRCTVSAIAPEHGVTYRSALVLDAEPLLLGAAVAPHGYEVPEPSLVLNADSGADLPNAHGACVGSIPEGAK